MENQRLFLYLGLGFISLLLYQAWMLDYGPRPEPAPAAVTAGPASAQTASGEDIPVVQSEGTVVTAAPVPSQTDVATGRRLSVSTDVMTATIDTVGGTLVGLTLNNYPVSIDEPDVPFSLLSDKPEHFMIAQSGLQGVEGIEAPTHKSLFTAEADSYTLGAGSQVLVVPLVWESAGLRVTKQYTFTANSYQVDVEFIIENNTGKAWTGIQYHQLQREPANSDEESFFIRTYTGGVISTDVERYEKVDFGDMEDNDLSTTTKGGWVAMIQHYFGAAWIPGADETSTFYSIHLRSLNRYIIGMKSQVKTIAAGTTATMSASSYIGPKVQDWLKAAAPQLELTVDFGWLTILAQPLFWLLKKIHSIIGNWGWAIMVLTLLIKLFFYPLSQASYKSMARMKKLQPKLLALKERHGDDRAKMGQATMELYKKEKVNPLGGCLPMIIQIPVFIALYWMLLESVELRQAPWALWIKDMSIKDPLYILPVIMGITMFIQQKLNPAPTDPIQAKVFMFLPLIFSVFFAFFPAGLVLYWIVNNTLSIAQQYYIIRYVIGDK